MENIDKLTELVFTLSRITRDGIDDKNNSLSYIQSQTLSFLIRKKTPTMKEISEYINITAPSTTTLIDNMVKMKYISRIYDKTDRRMIRLKITKNGQRALELGLIAAKKHLEKIFGKLSKKDRDDFELILNKLSKLFK